MSKIGQLNLDLQEQANELGFSTVQEALDAGYEVDYECGTFKDPQEQAHEAWLKEKEEVINELRSVYNDIDVPLDNKKLIKHAIEFIERGEV